MPSSSGRERGVSVLISECPSDKAQLQDSWVHWEVERTGVVHVGDEVVGLAVGWDAPMRFTSAVGGDLSPSELLLQLDGLRVTRKRIRLQLERTLHVWSFCRVWFLLGIAWFLLGRGFILALPLQLTPSSDP